MKAVLFNIITSKVFNLTIEQHNCRWKRAQGLTLSYRFKEMVMVKVHKFSAHFQDSHIPECLSRGPSNFSRGRLPYSEKDWEVCAAVT